MLQPDVLFVSKKTQGRPTSLVSHNLIVSASSSFSSSEPDYSDYIESLPTSLVENGQYVESKLHGISLLVPKKIIGPVCIRDGAGSQEIVKLGYEYIPVQYSEDETGISIHFEYADGYTIDGGCEREYPDKTSLLYGNSHHGYGWRIETRKVRDEGELLSFVRKMYGEECELGDFRASHLPNVENVTIYPKGVHRELYEQNLDHCPTNFAFTILYNRDKQKALILTLGQEAKFWNTQYYDTSYDLQMLASMRIE
jgi:hypothetical protein